MERLNKEGAAGWVVPGIGVTAVMAIGLVLRPHTPTHSARAAVIASMQMIVVSGVAGALVARLSPHQIYRLFIACLAAALCGLIAATGNLLPPAEIAQIAIASWLWCTLCHGLSAVTDQMSGHHRHVPLAAVTLCIVVPLWPIVAAPLIGAAGNSAAAIPLNVMLNLSPCIWLIHITQGTTGMNTIGWFHSHLLYRVVPLGQNVLMPKVMPWYWPAGALGVLGAGLAWLTAWRRKPAAKG